MPHSTSLIAILCVGFVLAFIFGLAAQRLRLSPLVGYLLAGIVAGPFTPGFVGDPELAPQLAEIGVILLMFGVGLHFSVKDLLAVRAIALPGALVQIAVATVLGWGLARVLGWSHVAGFVFGLSLSCASTVVLLRALEARRLLETTKGRIAIGWLIVEDLVCVIALVLLPVLADVLGGDSEGGSVWQALGITALKVGAFVALMLLVGRRAVPWVLERVAGTGSRELFTLCVLAIALGLAFVASELFGVSFALGAFFAGMLLNESEFSHKAASDSLPMRDAFAVLFFVAVGMLFNPNVLVEHPLQVLLTFLIIVFGKSLAAWAIVRMLGKSNATALVIAASLAQIGEFSFILAGLGLSLQILPELGHSLILAGALLSILCNPLIFTLLSRLQARQARDAAAAAPAADAEPPVIPIDITDHAIVAGYGRVGRELAALLHERGMAMVIVEEDEDRAARARADGHATVRGNIASTQVMLEAAPARARLAIFAIPNALEAGEAIARMKALRPDLTIIARAHSDREVEHLLRHGADGTVMAERELAYSLADMAGSCPLPSAAA